MLIRPNMAGTIRFLLNYAFISIVKLLNKAVTNSGMKKSPIPLHSEHNTPIFFYTVYNS